MAPARWSGLVVVLALAFVPSTSAQAPAPCPPGSPQPVFTVNGGAGPVYTTHDLLVRVRLSGGALFSVESFEVTGVRRLPHPDGDDARQPEIHAIADQPGTLTATATLTNEDGETLCTVTGTASFEVRAATTPVVSRLRRPPPFRAKPGLVWDSRYWFRVTPGPTGVRTPLTIEARAIRAARVPGPGVRAARVTYPMRPSDGAPPELRPVRRGCSDNELICPRTVRTWPTGASVAVLTRGGRAVPASIRVLVTLPRGYPVGRRLAKTPVGVDVRVLQDGAAIARLRLAGRCDPMGQFSRCRFKTLSTAL